MPLIIESETRRWRGLLEEKGVLQSGHFVLRSGRHSSHYLDKRRFMAEMSHEFDWLCDRIAAALLRDGYDVVAAPATTGILVAQRVAKIVITHGNRTEVVPAEKVDSTQRIPQEYASRVAGSPVAVIEDVVTTAGTALAVGAEIRRMGGSCGAVYCLFQRSDEMIIGGIRVKPVLRLDLDDYEENCPLCEKGVPFTSLS